MGGVGGDTKAGGRGARLENICPSVAMRLSCCVVLYLVMPVLADVRLLTQPSDGGVQLTLTARTTGYFGVGFSLDGKLASSDVLMAWVDSDGRGHIVDGHGVVGSSTPEKDRLQNYKLLDSFENSTHTIVRVYRAWDTCDRKGDVVFLNDTMRVIWTVSEYDPPLFGWGAMEWSGPKSLLIANSNPAPLTQRRVPYWDVVAQDFTLPGDSPSFHWCKIYKVPSLPQKHHIIGYRAKVEEGHENLVTKMVLYECLGGSEFEIFGSHPGAPCHHPLTPTEWKACHTPVVVWAAGAQGEYLPPHIGIPIAEGEGKSTYFMFEIHYDNPALQRVRDNSGLRLYYSDEVREFDSSMLMTGIAPTPIHMIPPKQRLFATRGYCDNQCTNLMFPEKGIKIVSVRFHTHSAGRQVRLRHVRQGKELQVIAQDKYFDPDYQEAKKMLSEVTVLPGDDLITECSYTTANTSQPLLGGHGSEDETCLAYLLYYPRTALATCTSIASVDFFFHTFGIEQFYNRNMDEVEQMLITQSEKSVMKATKPPMQSLFFRFSQKEGFNIDHSKPYIDVEPNVREEGLLSELIIDKPLEFQNKSFLSHLKELPWSERVFTQRVEEILNGGSFTTFCRLQDSTPAMPSGTYNMPNISWVQEDAEVEPTCRSDFSYVDSSSSTSLLSISLLVITHLVFVLI